MVRTELSFVSSGSPRKASAPTPKDGDKMVYCPNSSTGNWLTLKWYSGYNVTAANDVVYFGTRVLTRLTQIGSPVPATRGQHSSTVDVNIVPNKTYYWKVVTIDGTNVSSDVWSFKTVNWQCKEPNDTDDPNQLPAGVGYIPYDCVINFDDFWYFAKDWQQSGIWRYQFAGPS